MHTKLVLFVACGIVAAGPGWAEPPTLEPLSSPTLGAITAASAPALGAASLTVDQQIHLGAASNVFKDGYVFLWDDTTGNTALGRDALTSVAGDATQNTALGWGALQNATGGTFLFEGSNNTAVGYGALYASTTGASNTAIGLLTLYKNDTGRGNTAVGGITLYDNISGRYNTGVGYHALVDNTTGSFNTGCGGFTLRKNNGSYNVALGYRAGYDATTGDDNIFIANEGVAGESDSIRIGTQGTQTHTFIAAIHGASVDAASDLPVLVDSTGKLGTTTSSQRFKEDVAEIGEGSSRLLRLRPVKFRFKKQEGKGPVQYGLLAEEVAEILPELVVDDEEGQPYAVRYHVLIPLLLNELQKQHAEVEALRRRLARLEEGQKGIP